MRVAKARRAAQRFEIGFFFILIPVFLCVCVYRTKAPPRPTAQRTEPETSTFHGFGFPDGGGFHMSFGIGAFPFGFFTSSFNFGSEGRPVSK